MSTPKFPTERARMMCPQCQARNSPAAFVCHNCEAELSREWEAPRPASTWSTRSRSAGALAAACLLLLGAARAGEWVGDWLARNPPPSKAEARAVPDDRTLLEARYEAWKQAHALPTEDLMALHATDARIVFTGGQAGNLDELRQLAQQVRQSRTCDRVSDIGSVRISIQDTRATITARHRYGHSSNPQQPSFGDRTLTWELRNGAWIVVHDRFPSSFSDKP